MTILEPEAVYSEASLQSCSRGNMSQRSIKSFFTPKSAETVKKTGDGNGANSIKKKKLSIESDPEDEQNCKENIPNAQSSETPDADPEKPDGSSVSEDSAQQNGKPSTDIPETNLNLPVPHRKTARKAFKRKSDVEQLQEQKIKKLKADQSKDVASVAEQEAESSSASKSEDVEDIKMECEESVDSPVKVKTKKNRILSDSEDDSPKKSPPRKKFLSPEKAKSPSKSSETKSAPVKSFSIFNVKKSPSKSSKDEAKSDKSPKKTPTKVKSESPESQSKDKSKKTTKAESPPKKSKSPSPVKTEKSPTAVKAENSPKPSTSKEGVANKPKPKNPFQGFFGPKSKSDEKSEGKDYDKKVKKTQYHPVDDAFWKHGDKTPFLALANTLLAIEETSGRLKTIEILSNYFRSVMVLSPQDLLPSIYFVLNKLAPAWEGLELGIGETILMKAVANTTGRSVQHMKVEFEKFGDLGIVAENSKSSQRTMFQPAPLTLETVFTKIRDIACMTGNSSTQKKVEKIQSLMVACRGSEARFLVRSLSGKLRIGLAEQSVLQALAQACLQTPVGQEFPPAVHTAFKSAESESFKEKLAPLALKLKSAYCECPTYDILVPQLLTVGIDGLSERCKLTPGIPLKPMLAHPTKGVQEVLTRFEDCKFTCEWKYDGERAQVHLHPDGKINIFSRNQENNTTKYPDIIARFPSCLAPGVESAILDCEAVAWDREKKTIQPFQILSTRKRKDAVESEIKVQVCLFGFDLLYLNGESLIKQNFQERRNLLREKFLEVEGEFHFAKGIDGNTTEEIQEALEESIKDNCEGLMVKTLDREATYEIARRSHNWLKLKKDYLEGVGDTVDLVVIGGYLGKGKRTGRYGGFLLACYDSENEEYQSICKIGTGFSDEDLQKHATFFKDQVIEKPKGYYNFDPSHMPDHWFEPVQVWEVKCADLSVSPAHKAAIGIVDPSKGVSLRFPRFIRIREDKNAEDATSAEQIAEMYNNQDQIKNQNKDKAGNMEDDFDF